ncbi:MAG: hypothetical protein DI603_17820 [Roseateles depolymerans]|uniref:Uncharacterized protein n=1 Tax=Roseateles depolymerans TaxID=76731 RepID=A0A2W5DF79_9BURK|nr:MAG: hypothetical protein DI603_17820 [Roseateles depolymerans]
MLLQEDAFVKPVIRFLRMRCRSPDAPPEPHRDGVLAVAAINERAGLARLLLVDMGPWGRNDGASVTNAFQVIVPAAHRWLIGGFGVSLSETLIVELDGAGHFDLIGDLGDGAGLRHMPLPAARGTSTPRTRAAFMQWAGEAAVPMLKAVDAMREGMWAGVEG